MARKIEIEPEAKTETTEIKEPVKGTEQSTSAVIAALNALIGKR